jgi:hypothetical protein
MPSRWRPSAVWGIATCKRLLALGKSDYYFSFGLHSVFLRRFSDSFGQLRLERLQLKRSRNTEKLVTFENEMFSWPIKEDTQDPGSSGEIPDIHDPEQVASAGGDGNTIE